MIEQTHVDICVEKIFDSNMGDPKRIMIAIFGKGWIFSRSGGSNIGDPRWIVIALLKYEDGFFLGQVDVVLGYPKSKKIS